MDEFNSILSQKRQDDGRRRAPTDVSDDILWVWVGFSTRFDAVGVAHWHRRVQAFMSNCGLTAAIAVERIAIFPVGAAITTIDQGQVIGWLTCQPEVVFVHVDRCPSRGHAAFAHSGRPHGQDT